MSQQRGAARMWWTYSREETQQKLLECEAIGENLGGGFVVTPIRQRVIERTEHQDGTVTEQPANDPSGKPLYQTVAWCFRHESFMPAVDPARTAPVPLPPEEEPTEVLKTPWEGERMQPPTEEVVAQLVEDEPVYGDPTEGLTPTEIEANRAARAAEGGAEAADAVVAADGRAQS